ncbi:MAG: hypothetical protein PUP46_07430 [Endozoicomonas sp. (ex Botrylloides leachii)]|nr:hypothetical protein [Endozoicomonas sp. (ex Botrylloides leachii)]
MALSSSFNVYVVQQNDNLKLIAEQLDSQPCDKEPITASLNIADNSSYFGHITNSICKNSFQYLFLEGWGKLKSKIEGKTQDHDININNLVIGFAGYSYQFRQDRDGEERQKSEDKFNNFKQVVSLNVGVKKANIQFMDDAKIVGLSALRYHEHDHGKGNIVYVIHATTMGQLLKVTKKNGKESINREEVDSIDGIEGGRFEIGERVRSELFQEDGIRENQGIETSMLPLKNMLLKYPCIATHLNNASFDSRFAMGMEKKLVPKNILGSYVQKISCGIKPNPNNFPSSLNDQWASAQSVAESKQEIAEKNLIKLVNEAIEKAKQEECLPVYVFSNDYYPDEASDKSLKYAARGYFKYNEVVFIEGKEAVDAVLLAGKKLVEEQQNLKSTDDNKEMLNL